MSESKHTPGPWRWYGNAERGFCLARAAHGRPVVMGFEELGVHGVQPSFRVDGYMVCGCDLCRFEVAPEIIGMENAIKNKGRVYKYDIIGFDHPDANLIAAAPEMLEELEKVQEECQVSWDCVSCDVCDRKKDCSLAKVINKAKGVGNE